MTETRTERDMISTVLYATGGMLDIAVTRRLAERRSAFQEILVVDTVDHGRCLVIDGVMQTASTDHGLYDDAILARLRPEDRDILLIGGGDGYVARRVHQRAPAARLVVVEIDPDVVELAETWLNPGFQTDPRTHLHIGDGVAFARGLPRASFDGVVLDLTDIPLDPACSRDVTRLFQDMLDAVLPLIRPGGWLAMQGGPSAVPAGEQDVAALVAALLAGTLADLVREDVTLPSYGEGNAFFHGIVAAAARVWHDRTEGIGLCTALELRPVYRAASPDGPVEVFDHARLGRALVVDGVLYNIAGDAALREMLVHVPLLGHPRPPRRVGIVGGGDGLVLNEVLRHDFVEQVAVWETNPVLAEVGARFLGTGEALADPRVCIAEEAAGIYDVLLMARPAAPAFARRLAGLLAPDGLLVDADAIVLALTGPRWYRGAPTLRAESGLARVGRYFATGAVVPGGFYGFDLLGPSAVDASVPRQRCEGHHYNAELHTAAFALPRLFRELP